ncbi:hypothetical protein ACFV7Q_36370, partial [Streptomyces sp. NPDC059851]
DGAKMLPDGTVHLPSGAAVPEGAIKLPNDTIKLPDGTATLPPGTVKLPFDGPAKYLDGDGNYYKADGSLYQHIDEAPVEKTPKMPDGAGTPKVDAPKTDAPATVKAEDRVLAAVGGRGDDVIRLGSDISDPIRTVGDHTPGPRPDTTPGGHAPDNMPRNSTDTQPPSTGGRTDTPTTPGPRTDTPSTGSSYTDNQAGAAGRTDGPSTGGGHSGTPGGGAGHADDASTSGAHAGTPGAGDDAATGAPAASGTPGAGAADDAAAATPATPRKPMERPSFMLHGDNPYGPPGHLTDAQVQQIQVYRANEEPGYFEKYYKENGNRKRLAFKDESGTTPPQLTRLNENSPWIRVKDAPDPPTPHYLDPKLLHKDADTVSDKGRLARLKAATIDRYFAIEWRNLTESLKSDAEKTHKAIDTDETRGLWAESRGAYREAHAQMIKETEKYGEFVAEHHYIAENHAGAVKQTLHGPKNGNDQFDQVWRRPDGKYVVVECKSSIDTRLGGRNLPNGRRVSQGSQEYFLDIIREMEERGKKIKSERKLAEDLKVALEEGKLEYVLVKGDRNAPAYNGYHHQRFDLSKRSLR